MPRVARRCAYVGSLALLSIRVERKEKVCERQGEEEREREREIDR
jgi:hypothetical protein